MQNQYKQYLINLGFKEFTPSGARSTTSDYCSRINKICKIEQITWQELKEKIDDVLPLYERLGNKSIIGKRSHDSIINALRHFKIFVKTDIVL